MDIKDMELFRLEDRMLFEAAAAANIVAAADAANNAGDDGNNDEEKNNSDLNVALFVAPEANGGDDAMDTDIVNATDVDAQAKNLVEGALPAVDDSTGILSPVIADAQADTDADADGDFVDGTLHADNADSFTVDAMSSHDDAATDADADQDILGGWVTDDIQNDADAFSVDGSIAAIAAERTFIDIDADVDDDADDTHFAVNSDADDDMDDATRSGNHELSLDFSAHKTYDGTTDIEGDQLQLEATFDGLDMTVSGTFENDVWTFNFSDSADNGIVVVVQDVFFDSRDASVESITIGSFSIEGDSLDDVDILVNGQDISPTRTGEALVAAGSIDQREITISIQDKDMTYGEDETNLRFHYKVTGELLENEFISADYELASYLDAFRTAKDADGNGGNIQYRATPYEDAITFKLDKLKIFDSKGTNVTDNYIINTENGDLTVAQRMLSVTIQPLVFVYGQDIGDVPDYGVDKDGNPNVSYTFDSHGLVAGDDLNVTLKYNPKPLEGQYSNSGYLGSNSYTNAIIQDEVNLENASNYSVQWNSGTLIVTPKQINVDYLTKSKVYDGTTKAERNTEADFLLSEEIFAGDIVKLFDTNVIYTFESPDVGKDIKVTATNDFFALGQDASNYDFVFNLISKGDITPAKATINFEAQNKVYDGNTDANLKTVTIEGLIADGDVTIDAGKMTYAFSDPNVGEGKTVTAIGYSEDLLGGSQLKNYTVTFEETTTAKITPLDITIGFTAKGKVYDGDTDAKRNELVMDQVLAGDEVEFDDSAIEYNFDTKDVGTGKTVTATGFEESMLSGKDLANYNVTFIETAEAYITPLAITIGFTANNKTYDGNNDAARKELVMDDVLKGDNVEFDDSAIEYNFDDKNVGVGKTVTATGYDKSMLSGKDLANYDITFIETTTANIDKLDITIGFTANGKTYNGNTDATRDQLVMDEVLKGDDVAFDDTAIEYTFDTKDAGKDKTVTATGYDKSMLSGKDLANYNVTFVNTALAEITPLAITIGFTANDKTYDGNTTATRDQLLMDKVLKGDEVAFDDSALEYNFDTKDAGKGKTVTATGFDAATMLSGKDLANYDITFIETATAAIKPREITIGFTAKNKTYDGNTIATRDQLLMDQVLEGDDVAFDDSGLEYNFDTKEAGEDKTVTATGFDAATMLSGDDLDNYDITFIDTTLAEITAKAIIVKADDKTMTYGDPNPSLTYTYEGDLPTGHYITVALDMDIAETSITDTGHIKAGSYENSITAIATIYDENGNEVTNDYTINYDFGDLTVDLRSITVTAASQKMTYGEKMPDLTGKYSYDPNALADGDKLEVVLKYDDAMERSTSGNVVAGLHTHSVLEDTHTLTNGENYNYTFNDASLDVIAKQVTVRFDAADKDYDGNTAAEREGDFVLDGFVKGDVVHVFDNDVTYAFSDKNAGTDKTVTATGELVYVGDDVNNYTFDFENTTLADITPLKIKIGFTASSKTYDGNDNAVRDKLVMDKVLKGDDVSFDDSAIEYNFSDKNVGEDKTVTAIGYDANTMLSGKDLANYDITFVDTALADITPLAITIGFTAKDKTYDGNDIAERNDLVMEQVLEGDDVTFDDSALEYNFDDKNVGKDKTVTATGYDANTMLSGKDLANYDITFIDTTTANIDKLAITIGFTANNKTYDGNTIATRDQLIMDQVLEGDDVAFNDSGLEYNFDTKDVGEGKTVTATGYDADSMLSGKDLGNYDITFIDTTTARIDKLGITIGFTANNKNYDGTTVATRDKLVMDQVLEGDDVAFDDSGLEYNFDTKAPGFDKTVTATGFDADTMLSGEDLGNYDITFIDTTLANIFAKSITVKADDKTMTYGDAAPSLTYTYDGDLADGHYVAVVLNLDIPEEHITNTGHIKAGQYVDSIIAVATIYDENGNVITDHYTINYDFGDLTVDLRSITVTAASQEMTYGETMPDLTGQYSFDPNALAKGDELSVVLKYEIPDVDLSGSGNVNTGIHSGVIIEDNHTLTNDENYNYTFNAASLNVIAKEITVRFDAADKTYDGDVKAERKGDFILDGFIEGDVVHVFDNDMSYSFSDKNVGNDKTVTATGELVYVGDDVANYDFTFDNTAFANITPLTITIGFTANNKTYDGNTTATRDALNMSAVLTGDDVTFDDSALEYNFSDKNVGEGKTVTATGFDQSMLSGDDLANYDVIFDDTALANITPLAINIGFTANNKTYDGNTTATRDQLVMDQVLEGDQIAFDDSGLEYNFDTKNAGEDKTVTATGFDQSMLSGDDLANYDITFVDTALADITPLGITIGFTANNKRYDGNTLATRNQLIMDQVLEGDKVTFDDSGLEYNFDTKDVGEGKTVTATGFDQSMLSGDDLANYDITFIDTTTANITMFAITVKANDQSMTYGDEMPSFTYTFEDALEGDDMIQIAVGLNVSESDYTNTNHLKANTYVNSINAVATIYDGEGHIVTDNYDIIYVAGTLTVDLRNITVTAKSQEMTYGDEQPDLTGQYTFDENALADGDTLNVNLEYKIADEDLSSSGKVAAGLHAGAVIEKSHELMNGENYNYTFNDASLYVKPREINVSFDANDKPYDGTTEATRKGDFNLGGLVAGDIVHVFDSNITYAFDQATVLRDADGNVLERTVTATGELITVGDDVANYTFNFQNTSEAKITPIDLTVTAVNQSMTYGDENPDLDGQYMVEGLLDIDTLNVTLAYDSANIPTSASGHFKAGEHEDAIIEASHALTNEGSYNYHFINGDLTVAKRPISISADDKEITYGDGIGELTYKFTGELADGDSLDDTTLRPDGTPNSNGRYNVGTYDIIIDEPGIDINDYEITCEPGTLIVNPKEIIVTAHDKVKMERMPDPRLTYTVDGLLDRDQLSGRLTREPGEEIGEYEILQGTLAANANYSLVYNPGTLTIVEAPPPPEPEPDPEPSLRNITQEPEQSNRNYNGPMDFEVVDYRPFIPDIHPKWDVRSRFNEHRVDSLAQSIDLWMDIDSLDTILVPKVISTSNSANERGFASGSEMFPNDTQSSINMVRPSDDFDKPLIEKIDVLGDNNDTPWIFIDESIQIPKILEQDIVDDAADDIDPLGMLADVQLNEPSKHSAFKSDIELLLDGLMA